MDSYTLSRSWFNWCFENPELVSPNHSAIYFFAIEHCNRLGWKDKFGFPTQMAMDAIGIKKHQTYIKYFNDLCEWGFFLLVQKSSNQYSANIISLISAKPKSGKALDKALIKHGAKQTETNGQSTGQSNSPIYKQGTKEQLTNKPETNYFRLRENIIPGKVSDYFKKNNELFLEGWAMKNKDVPVDEILNRMDTDYAAYNFNNDNHIQNSFKSTYEKIKRGNGSYKKPTARTESKSGEDFGTL